MSQDRVLHVSVGGSDLPWPRPPADLVTADLWWCEGESPEDGQFALVSAPTRDDAARVAADDYHAQTGDQIDPSEWSVTPATADEVIAWWRRVQWPCLDADPEATDDDCDDVGACPSCGRPPVPLGIDKYGDPRAGCCLWREAWSRADCDGDEDRAGVPLRPVTP